MLSSALQRVEDGLSVSGSSEASLRFPRKAKENWVCQRWAPPPKMGWLSAWFLLATKKGFPKIKGRSECMLGVSSWNQGIAHSKGPVIDSGIFGRGSFPYRLQKQVGTLILTSQLDYPADLNPSISRIARFNAIGPGQHLGDFS